MGNTPIQYARVNDDAHLVAMLRANAAGSPRAVKKAVSDHPPSTSLLKKPLKKQLQAKEVGNKPYADNTVAV